LKKEVVNLQGENGYPYTIYVYVIQTDASGYGIRGAVRLYKNGTLCE